MISSFGHSGNHHERSWPFRKCSLGNLRLHESPGSENYPENVIIVMDGMEEFTIQPLKWALENVIVPGRSVLTLVGVMPWLNIPHKRCILYRYAYLLNKLIICLIFHPNMENYWAFSSLFQDSMA